MSFCLVSFIPMTSFVFCIRQNWRGNCAVLHMSEEKKGGGEAGRCVCVRERETQREREGGGGEIQRYRNRRRTRQSLV